VCRKLVLDLILFRWCAENWWDFDFVFWVEKIGFGSDFGRRCYGSDLVLVLVRVAGVAEAATVVADAALEEEDDDLIGFGELCDM